MSDRRIIIVFAILIAALFIISIVRKIFKSYFLNKIANILVYLIELYFFGTLISLLLYKGSFQNHTSFLMIFKDYVFANSIYQIILNIILKFWDGTTIDAYNSIQTAIKKIKLHSSNKDKLSEYLDWFKDKMTALDKEKPYNKYATNVIGNLILATDTYLKNDVLESDFVKYLDEHLIDIENEKNLISFGWQNSLFLRIIK